MLGEGQLLNPKDKASRRQRKIAAARVCKGQGEAEQEQGKMGTLWAKKKVQVGLRKPEGLKTWEQQGECEPKSKRGGARAMESQESLGSLLG